MKSTRIFSHLGMWDLDPTGWTSPNPLADNNYKTWTNRQWREQIYSGRKPVLTRRRKAAGCTNNYHLWGAMLVLWANSSGRECTWEIPKSFWLGNQNNETWILWTLKSVGEIPEGKELEPESPNSVLLTLLTHIWTMHA